MYKSNKMKASCRIFFFFFLAITLRLCGNVLFTMIERERERHRDGERERKKGEVGACQGMLRINAQWGGLAEGGGGRVVMWPAPGSPHINTGRSQNMFPKQPPHARAHTHVQTARNGFVEMQTHTHTQIRHKYVSVRTGSCILPPTPPHLEFHSFPNKSIPF